MPKPKIDNNADFGAREAHSRIFEWALNAICGLKAWREDDPASFLADQDQALQKLEQLAQPYVRQRSSACPSTCRGCRLPIARTLH